MDNFTKVTDYDLAQIWKGDISITLEDSQGQEWTGNIDLENFLDHIKSPTLIPAVDHKDRYCLVSKNMFIKSTGGLIEVDRDFPKSILLEEAKPSELETALGCTLLDAFFEFLSKFSMQIDFEPVDNPDNPPFAFDDAAEEAYRDFRRNQGIL